ncbi:MAG: response regulator [Verrucomicrobiota bacterium]|jgi:CheY-like chemotaxis protein
MQEPNLPEPEPRIYEIPDDLLETKHKTVLVLEDDAVFVDTLKDTLEWFGYRVTAVPTGTEGVQQILTTDFDAIVCDMVMPNFPGDMFYLAVQRSRPHLCQRFIFITGQQDNPKIIQFIKQSGCVALWKPFKARQLLDALEVTCGRRQPVPAGTINPLPNIEPVGSWNFSMQKGGAKISPSR